MLELDGATLSYEEFRAQCLEPNRPAIIRNAAACGHFDMERLRSQLSPSGLCSLLGPEHVVPVYAVHRATGGRAAAEAQQRHVDGEYECAEKPLEEVLASWGAAEGGPSLSEQGLSYYLKDWHMQADVEAAVGAHGAGGCGGVETAARPHGSGLYRVPPYLGADWMDSFCRAVEDNCAVKGTGGDETDDEAVPTLPMKGFGDGQHDYRFAYIGATNTWTGLHHDVFGSYSWSFNVCGEKLWYFPDAEGNAYLHRTLVKGFPTPPDMRVLTGFQFWTCLQRPGDLVFVPSRYFHQVHNTVGEVFLFTPSSSELTGTAAAAKRTPVSMELTIAVNHNWCNQFCVTQTVQTFLADVDTLLGMVDEEDLRVIFGDDGERQSWREHVERMLHGGCNWGFESILSFLGHCAREFGRDDDGKVGEQLHCLTQRVKEKRDAMFT